MRGQNFRYVVDQACPPGYRLAYVPTRTETYQLACQTVTISNPFTRLEYTRTHCPKPVSRTVPAHWECQPALQELGVDGLPTIQRS